MSLGFRFAHEPVRGDANGRFVGRAAELDTLVQRILFSEGGSFLVTGYRGVGKTSFVGQVIRTLREASRWATPVLGETEVVDVHLTIARPLSPAELMHHIIRRLHDRLDQQGVLQRLDVDLRTRLALASQRTSMNMSRKQAETTGGSAGVSDLSLPAAGAFKLTLSRTRTRSQESALEYLAYDDKAAEYDIIDIAQRLTRGYRTPAGWLDRWLPSRHATGPRVTLKIVFVFDELDKLDEVDAAGNRPARPYLDDLLHSLKNLFTTSGMCFVFVAGKDLQERWLEDVGRGDSVYESVFCYDKYLPCMWGDVDHICSGIVDRSRGVSAAEEALFSDFKRYLDYRGRGIPRRIIRALNEHVQWVELPYLAFGRDDLRRVRFYAGLERHLRGQGARLFPELPDDSARTVYDKRRLGVYYLVDWVLQRWSREFTAADAVKAARALSTKIALADESAVDVVNDMLAVLVEGAYIEEVPLTLGAVRVGEVESRRERLYRLTVQTRAQVGESSGPAQDAAGSELFAGRYARLERLGSGGMGVVHKAFDRLLGRTVAIKMLRGDLASEPQVLGRFRREAQLLRRVRHPNVVEYLDAGTADGADFIVMEFIDGTSLGQVLRTHGRVGTSEAVEIGLAVARVLEFMHDMEIVRSDIKPENILIAREGRVVVTDLGIAKLVSESAERQDETAGAIGTPYYMAPEQFEGGAVDGRVDVYACGVVLYEMLTGTRPFTGANVFETMRAHLDTNPSPPSVLAPVPAALDAIVMKAMSRRPEDRYRSGGELVKALAEVHQAGVANLSLLFSSARERLSVEEARDEYKTAVVGEPTLVGAGQMGENVTRTYGEAPALTPDTFVVPIADPRVAAASRATPPSAPAPARSSAPVPPPPAPPSAPPSDRRFADGSIAEPTRTRAPALAEPLPVAASPAVPAASPAPQPVAQPPAVGPLPDPVWKGAPPVAAVPAPPPGGDAPSPTRESPAQNRHAPGARDALAARLLVVVDGPDAGLRVELPRSGHSLTLGRAGSSDVALMSTGLSRVHARIDATSDGRWLIADMNSRNGTFVNGESAIQPIALAPGMTIHMADVTLRVEP